ncbi:MAG: NAD-dependent epimerase/dehydratase family protein [Saccharospirillaceae bacterium]|nr:NAD-dependent epimerase/dehydratase family protein [Pseudomonadales bacterium]NRB78338.1 NAD-dependent epimerase/dehydratase family protein [Saccharospirillaceae bacterium]
MTIKKILVTGASGYLASWVIKQLLDQGHIVNATVRSLKDEVKVKHLLSMQSEFKHQLNLFEADLMLEDSFTAAMSGCDTVIHTASPYYLDKPKDVYNDMINPAIKGTQNVLTSVNKIQSVKKVVLTSSIVALYNNACDYQSIKDNKVLEAHVNNNQNPNYNSYAFSKIQAEKAAWLMQSEQSRWQLVTVHPGAIFGPSLSDRQDATSVKMLIQFLNGSFNSGVPDLHLGIVDVRDAAKLHVITALNDNTEGKYIAVGKTLSLLEIGQTLDLKQFNIPDKLPKKVLPKWLVWLVAPMIDMQRSYIKQNVGYKIYFDNTRSAALLDNGFIDAKDTFNEHTKQIVASKLI